MGQHHLQSLAFLVPGAILLLAIVCLARPSRLSVTASTTGQQPRRSGLSNYKSLFSTADTLIAFRNNVIWVLVFPFIVTVIGLYLLSYRNGIRWSTAFKDCHLPADCLQRHRLFTGLYPDLPAGSHVGA